MFQVLNLKTGAPSVEEALANFEIALSQAIFCGAKAIKLVHGYGSHGVGGKILRALKPRLAQLKKQKKIKDYIFGAAWSYSNPTAMSLILAVPDAALDEDLNTSNIGITVVILN